MNKIYNINLGGYPFVIDDNAFTYLQKYLKSLKRQFDGAEGYEEIISDIECRLAELIEERLDARQIVSFDLISEVTNIMGEPADFMEEEEGEFEKTRTEEKSSNHDHEESTFNNYTRTRGKRLFRDPEDKVVGGVCSGLAAYLGVRDPLWVRLGFALALFGFGFGIFTYIILMIIIPKAETSADRLAMHGEPINIDNIAKSVEEEFGNLSGRFKEVKDEFKSRKKKRRRGWKRRNW